MSDIPDSKQHWTVDKRIPLALVITIVLQTGGLVWWAATISSRVAVLEQFRIEQVPAASSREGRIIRLETLAQGVAEALADVKTTLAEMNRKLDRAAGFPQPR